MMKSDKDVFHEDVNTYYVKSSDPKKEPYMVYNSINEGFLCDCMAFVMNMTGDGAVEQYQCKHILKVKEIYGV